MDFKGDNHVVALDTELSLISAWNPKKATLSYHGGKNRIEFTKTLGSDGHCSVTQAKKDGIFSSDLAQWVQNSFGNLLQ